MENFYFPKWRFSNVKDVLVQKIYLLHATFPSGRFTLYNLGALASSQGVSFLSKSKTTLKTSHEELAFVSVLITNYPCGADNYIFRIYIKKLMWNTQRWTYLMRATNNMLAYIDLGDTFDNKCMCIHETLTNTMLLNTAKNVTLGWKMLRKDWAADKIWQRSWQETQKVSECTSVFWECLRLSCCWQKSETDPGKGNWHAEPW